MNVFEDLITELKEENLLEDTVIDDHSNSSFYIDEDEAEDVPVQDFRIDDEPKAEVESLHDHQAAEPEREAASEPAAPLILDTAADAAQLAQPDPLQDRPLKKGKEFFKKRAIAEVSSLQMVEHVLTGVEREYLKVVPKTYDDFKAKKALNNFLHIADSVSSDGHAEAEFELMHETEAWCSALAERDKEMHVSALRQFCENTKPALSSQAMLAIARFYRNLPYSELVRAKFDFVITRLFSRPAENEKRMCLFSREETLKHIKTLYADWSSIPLYAADDDDSSVMLASLSFEDLAHEAENASTFDQLIKTDFFGRLRTFKESISETFFAPIVTAAAIEANVRIGNAYVTLIARERHKFDADSIQSKYGSLNDQVVADATGRTLDLVDILKAPLEEPPHPAEDTHFDHKDAQEMGRHAQAEAVADEKPLLKRSPNEFFQSIKNQVYSINRWVIAFSALMIFATAGLAIYSSYFAQTELPSPGVATVEFENAQFVEFVQKAKVSNAMLYVQLQPSWDVLPKEKRQEILQKMLADGAEKGYGEVNLISSNGKMVGYASATRLDVVMP